MDTHRRLAERLTGLLGEPVRQEHRHLWHVPAGPHVVNVVLDLPETNMRFRVWIFDPRRSGVGGVRSYAVESDDDLAEIIYDVEAISQRPVDERM